MPRDHRPAKCVRVLLAEDQGMRRGALALLLGMEADIEVVAQVGAGDQVVDAALTFRPDVALLDVDLPGRGGIDAAANLREECPDCRVIILTTFARPGCLRRAMEAGAVGFLVKDGPVEELAQAIRQALRGETVIDPALATDRLGAGPGTGVGVGPSAGLGGGPGAGSDTGPGSGSSPLTGREAEVLKASADGTSVADIAGKLRLSESTVRDCLSAAIGKTGARDPVEAVREARQRGWL
ncbi:DNA-binding response regulator [Streptomyces sp. WAC 01529]|uniref:response regulator transcription factor n=1 Tax=Streptomyces sp. WAC 01529 TaxID=2203205 RepID=UPI000F6E9ED7|nr:response regulator transcription factor [Streptomyces sp. WAC 01529]AZM52976.1 DNA-binding response regulator [Streptomyces sp. WAC 01529]